MLKYALIEIPNDRLLAIINNLHKYYNLGDIMIILTIPQLQFIEKYHKKLYTFDVTGLRVCGFDIDVVIPTDYSNDDIR